MMNKFLTITLLAAVITTVAAEKICYIGDYGLTPDTRENATPYVRKALEACKGEKDVVIVFPKGRYDFWPQHCVERCYYESNTTDVNPKRLAMLISNAEGLTLDGGGSEFVFHDRMQPFTVDSSASVILRNFSINWDVPLTAQAEVGETKDDYIDLIINAYESPYIIEGGKLVFVGEGWKSAWHGTMEFEKQSRIVTPQTGDPGCLRYKGAYRAEELKKGLVRVHAAFQRKPKSGNMLVLRHSERDHSGIYIADSRDVTVENVDIFHCCGLGILAQFSENLNYTNVRCVPDEKRGRILAGHDDGFHYSNCKGDLVVRNCTFHALMDDPINVHGTSVRIIERLSDKTLKCKYMHEQSVGMVWARKGEQTGFIENETMETVATGIVTDYKSIDNELFEISFEQPVPKAIEAGDALENLTWTSNVLITDSKFLSCRARGILLSTPGKIVVTNNIFESSGAAILIAGDANYWYETGGVKDVLIKGNTFNSPCMTSMYQFCEAVISICPEIPKPVNTALFHRNIRIVGNEFQMFDYPALYAFSVDGLTFADNRLIRSYDFEPFHSRKDGLTFKNCRKITISGNYEEGGILGTTIKLIDTPAKECRTDAKSPFKQIR